MKNQQYKKTDNLNGNIIDSIHVIWYDRDGNSAQIHIFLIYKINGFITNVTSRFSEVIFNNHYLAKDF